MIVLETSALMAIVQAEPAAQDCRGAIADHNELLIAAPTLTEALIVSTARGLEASMADLLADLFPTVLPLTEVRARSAFAAYLRWGRGFHKAKLNFGDCFAYALAKEKDCPLLYVGSDFRLTDIRSALA
ncbi:MAG: type II toxin-antitoxin system VapC family toxin [Allosphingosinicella sp.]|uniref:type II toxin-antitoxin system VapC family toxin n=1 Tax=Allosphingosinicella sp. TaxID=2823234 RepID=UPI003948FC70